MREIKFRAFQDGQMLTQPIPGVYAMKRFLGLLYEDTILMQFAGIKDNNGVEIYEGDIVTSSWHWEEPHVIELPDDYYHFQEYAIEDEMTIVGNVHQHPELLK